MGLTEEKYAMQRLSPAIDRARGIPGDAVSNERRTLPHLCQDLHGKRADTGPGETRSTQLQTLTEGGTYDGSHSYHSYISTTGAGAHHGGASGRGQRVSPVRCPEYVHRTAEPGGHYQHYNHEGGESTLRIYDTSN